MRYHMAPDDPGSNICSRATHLGPAVGEHIEAQVGLADKDGGKLAANLLHDVVHLEHA